MNRISGRQALAVAALACLCAGSWAMSPEGQGLAGTVHDFTAGGTGDVKGPPGTGLCTFCHTPQRAPGGGMLWNHTLSPNTFRWDAASTFGGTPLPGFSGATYKGASAKCLSCHDGSVALGDAAMFSGTADAGGGSWNQRIAAGAEVGAGGNLRGNHPIAVPYPMGRVPNTYNGVTNGGLRQEDVIASIMGSDEYFARL